LGKVNEIIPIKLNGEALEIAFNNKYLLDALKACDQEEVFIELATALTLAFISL
jgi:DNA polymerase-3 subunit beta